MKWLLALGLFLSSFSALAAQGIPETDTVTIPRTTYNQIVQQLQDLLNSNKSLEEKVQELQRIQSATPSLDFNEPLLITISKDGQVFVKDTMVGKLKIDELSYDVNLKLKTNIVRVPQDKSESFLDLKLKAAILQSYEPVETETKSFVSYGLALEPIHYKQFNLNLLVGNRLYGAALGIKVTEHMDALAGIGARYNDVKAFIIGLVFDL